MSCQLSEGVIYKILEGEIVTKPVFQILGYKRVPGDRNDRYRLLISDGKCGYPFAVLGTQLAGLISSGNLEKFTVVQVNNYVCTSLTPEKKIITLLDLEIISPGPRVGQRIGHPVPIGTESSFTSLPNSSLISPTMSLSDSTHRLINQTPVYSNLPTSPNTYYNLDHQTVDSTTNAPTSPNAYHMVGHQTVSSTNVPSPNAYHRLDNQTIGSTNVQTSPNTYHELNHKTVGSTNVPTSPNSYHMLRHQSNGSTNVPSSTNAYQRLDHKAVGCTNIPTSPNAYHKLDHKTVGSTNVPTSPNSYHVLGHQTIGSTNEPTSPNACHRSDHQTVSSTDVPTSPNACHKLYHQSVSSTNVLTSPNACHNVIPISSLTPYQNRWTIRARVTNKTDMREYSNSRGGGKFFSVDFIDESGEIRATAFNECADKFYSLIGTDKVYYISKARLKFAKKQFSTIKNDFEMDFTCDTTVAPCEGNFDSIPSLQFNFVPICQIYDLEKDSVVDVIGVCRSFQDVETISKANARELRKRDITLIDQNNTEIILTLWDKFAEDFNGCTNPVVALKGARIKDFRFRTLSTQFSTAVHINPDIEEGRVLRKWFDTVGRYMESQSISHSANSSFLTKNWKTLVQAREEIRGMVSEPQYYKAKATVLTAKRENCMYMSCPSDRCSKKVNSLPNGKYECLKCRCEYDNFKWRLLLKVSFADFSDEQWATCFDEKAESLLNKNALELQMLRESSEDEFDEIFSKITFEPYIFELRTEMEVYNEESQLKTVVFSASPVTPIEFSRKLLSDIKQMEEIL